jgi:hypothetical protein
MKTLFFFLLFSISSALSTDFYPAFELSEKDSSIYLVDQSQVYKYHLYTNEITSIQHSNDSKRIEFIYDVKMILNSDKTKLIIGLPDKVIFVNTNNFKIDYQFISSQELEYDFIKFMNLSTTLINDTLYVVGDYDQYIAININDYTFTNFNPDDVALVDDYDGSKYEPIIDNKSKRKIEFTSDRTLLLKDFNDNVISKVDYLNPQSDKRLYHGTKQNFILEDTNINSISIYDYSKDSLIQTSRLINSYGLESSNGDELKVNKLELFNNLLIQIKSPQFYCSSIPVFGIFNSVILTITKLDSDNYETIVLGSDENDYNYKLVGDSDIYEFYSNNVLKIKEKGNDEIYYQISEVDNPILIHDQLYYSRFNTIYQLDLPSKSIVNFYKHEFSISNIIEENGNVFFTDMNSTYVIENNNIRQLINLFAEDILFNDDKYFLINRKIIDFQIKLLYFESELSKSDEMYINTPKIEGLLIDFSDDFKKIIYENKGNSYLYDIETEQNVLLSQEKAPEPGRLNNLRFRSDLIIGEASAFTNSSSIYNRMYFFDSETGTFLCTNNVTHGFSGRIEDDIYINNCGSNKIYPLCNEYYLFKSVEEIEPDSIRNLVKIYDILGNSYDINADLNQGLYLYIYESENGLVTVKRIVE